MTAFVWLFVQFLTVAQTPAHNSAEPLEVNWKCTSARPGGHMARLWTSSPPDYTHLPPWAVSFRATHLFTCCASVVTPISAGANDATVSNERRQNARAHPSPPTPPSLAASPCLWFFFFHVCYSAVRSLSQCCSRANLVASLAYSPFFCNSAALIFIISNRATAHFPVIILSLSADNGGLRVTKSVFLESK